VLIAGADGWCLLVLMTADGFASPVPMPDTDG
jgi:hypothetical protein